MRDISEEAAHALSVLIEELRGEASAHSANATHEGAIVAEAFTGLADRLADRVRRRSCRSLIPE